MEGMVLKQSKRCGSSGEAECKGITMVTQQPWTCFPNDQIEAFRGLVGHKGSKEVENRIVKALTGWY